MNQLWENFAKDAEKYTTGVQVETFDYSINISLQYGYLFTETPKVACSTIKTILQKMELKNPDLYWKHFEDIHNRNYSPLLKPSQLGPLDSFLKSDKLYKFCFCRNPYTRLLSAYIDKIKTNKPEKKYILQSLGKDASDMTQEISFASFIHVISQQKVINMNSHWRPQYYQTFQEAISYDYIGKIEYFETDINSILSEISSDYQKYISTEKRHSTNSNKLLNIYYTPELKKLVQQIYEIDFSYFGYES